MKVIREGTWLDGAGASWPAGPCEASRRNDDAAALFALKQLELKL